MKKQFNLLLPIDLIKKIKLEATKLNISYSELVERLCKEGLKK